MIPIEWGVNSRTFKTHLRAEAVSKRHTPLCLPQDNLKMRQTTLSVARVMTATALLALPLISQGATIINGDFETGDFTGWSLDTDGFPADPATTNDFEVVDQGGDQKARIEIDYFETPGDFFSTPLNDAFFANTLYQSIDTSAPSGSELRLSFNWLLGGEASPFGNDSFIVGLGDGSGNLFDETGNFGFLLSTSQFVGGSYSTTLDYAAFANQPGWTLEFQLVSNFDAYGSYVDIDNVELDAAVTQVLNPSSPLLLLAGLAGWLLSIKKVRRR